MIYLDSCLVIYAFEDSSERGKRMRKLLSEDPAQEFAISPLVKMECLVGPMKEANLVLQRYYEAGLAQFVSLPLNEEVLLRAAELRARFGIKTPDALHIATAQVHDCDALWTNDDRLVKASHQLAINVLRD